jgi:uncharacterized membrane protein YcaP (DUF421 family)
MNSTVFFDGWTGLARILVVGTIAYVGLVVLLRLGGKRTVSRMNAFELIVTISLGSVLAATLLSQAVALAEGVLALALLIGLQYAVAWTEIRYGRIRGLARSEPALLVWRGKVMAAAMRREQVAEDDVRAAVRRSGILSLDDVHAAILETDGSISVVERGRNRGHGLTTFERLRRHTGHRED